MTGTEQSVSPATLQARAFLAQVDHLHATLGQPITNSAERKATKDFVIASIRQGAIPLLHLPIAGRFAISHPEEPDAD